MTRIIVSCLLLLCFNASAEQSSPHVLMVLWRGETVAEEGYRYELNRHGVDAQFTYLDAKQDKAHLAEALREMDSKLDDYDLVYSFGTTASKIVKVFLRDRKPQVFNVVTDPVASALVAKLTGRSEQLKITGVSNRIPVQRKLALAAEKFRFSRVLFLMNPKEQNSDIQRLEIHQACVSLSCEVETVRVYQDNLEGLQDQLRERMFDVDLIYIPGDSYLISHAKPIMDAARQGRYKTVVPTEGLFDLGGSVAVDPDYFNLGVEAAQSTIRILQGEHPGQIDVKLSENPKVYFRSQQ